MLPGILEFIATLGCWGLFAYKWVLIAAIVITWVSADPYNPIVQWINRVSRPLWNWCHQWLPQPLKFLDAYVAILVVIFLQTLLPATVRSVNLALQQLIPPETVLNQVAGHSLQGLGTVISSVCIFFMIVLAVWFFITLTNPAPGNPVVRIVYVLADPIITPLQRILPRAKVDFSPLVAIVLLFVFNHLVIDYIWRFGAMLSSPVRICVI